jgi:chitin synthase
MLTTFTKAQTRQALRAKAYTDVPHSWSVFLSQRRRWTLGATSNDLLLTTASHCHWFERLIAFSNVLTWSLNIFVIASIACMVVAFMHQPLWLVMTFIGIMMIPIFYYIIMAIWLPQTFKARMQYLFGLSMFVTCGPFLNISVMTYAIFNMDNFGWGKTRAVVKDDDVPTAAGQTSESRSSSDDAERASVDSEFVLSMPEKLGRSSAGPSSLEVYTPPSISEKSYDYDEEAGRTLIATSRMREASRFY